MIRQDVSSVGAAPKENNMRREVNMSAGGKAGGSARCLHNKLEREDLRGRIRVFHGGEKINFGQTHGGSLKLGGCTLAANIDRTLIPSDFGGRAERC